MTADKMINNRPTSLIYTNEKCVGCKKCISVCPVLTANQAVWENGKTKILVNGNQCVACGACFDACAHNARAYYDDTERFFEDLKNGEKISLLIAPAFMANYPLEYAKVLGGLKNLGANRIISVSFGADITTWGYIKYMTEHDFAGGISQPCPAIVGYIEKYIPELIPKLFPIHSPLMCGAIYAKKYMKIADKLAFISPCIAKKKEIEDPECAGYVSYNVTFDNLMQYVREHNISGPDAEDEIEYGLGSVYPMPGGLKENIYWFCGEDVFIRQIGGEKRAYELLEDYKKRVLDGKELPFMVDALNCEKGCIYGTGIEGKKNESEDILYEIQRIKHASKKNGNGHAFSRDLSPKQRLDMLNESFKELDINDFIRNYTDMSEGRKIARPSDAELNDIFMSMEKDTKEKQNVDCSACGYNTCRDMATAIYNGCNSINNCIQFVQAEVERESLEMVVNEGLRLALGETMPDRSIEVALEYMGKVLKGERAYIFEKNENGCDDNTYEWVAPGITPEKENLQNVEPDVCASWYKSFNENKNIVIKNVEDIRESDPIQYEVLQRQNIHSLVVVPLYINDSAIGFYGIDNPTAESYETAVNMLQIMGHFIVSALQRRNLVKELASMSLHDQLTHLGNRHAMEAYVEKKLKVNGSIGAIYCDITGLKRINDTMGHAEGDNYIAGAAKCLKKAFEGYGLFRMGGDELMALCPGITREELLQRTELLRTYLKENSIVMAIGSSFKEDAAKVNDAMSEAESMMYEDKAAYYRTAGIDRRR